MYIYVLFVCRKITRGFILRGENEYPTKSPDVEGIETPDLKYIYK